MRRNKAFLGGLLVLFGVVILQFLTHIILFVTGTTENRIVDIIMIVTTPVIIVAFFTYLIIFLTKTSLRRELEFDNAYNLGKKSDFFNAHAMDIAIRRKRFWRYTNRQAYVVAFSASNNSVVRATSRNSAISILNGHLSDYFTDYFRTHGSKARRDNVFCYYHGYFILYSFGNREFIEQFTNDLATALFKIAEENQVHVFVQPYFGIAQVTDPKENIFTSIDNALGARNYAEKTFQEKVYFDESVVKTATEDDIKELEKAMDDEEFVVYYQPKISLKTNEVVGSEALIRWNSSKYGFCGPDKFLSKAEEGGLMHDIDMYVFEKVCEDLSETKRKGRKMIPVSVNFSLYEFYAPNFLSDLTRILHSFDLDPGLIEIEITEGTSQANSFLAISYLKKIKEKGMKILMDDFGTGYSNLGNLNKLPIDKVKIDKSLIDNIVDNERTRESVRYLINLCIANGMESIAEGVDNAKQVEVLRRLHCDVIQGYYFSRPIPKDEYEKFIAEHRVDKKKTKGGNE